MVSHGSSLQREVSATSSEPAPVGEESSCENEFGCICKGAVLSPVQLELPADTVLHLLAIDASETFSLDAVSSACDVSRFAEPPPPLDGEMLRAHLQVFLL
jgi:hypothetical protein